MKINYKRLLVFLLLSINLILSYTASKYNIELNNSSNMFFLGSIIGGAFATPLYLALICLPFWVYKLIKKSQIIIINYILVFLVIGIACTYFMYYGNHADYSRDKELITKKHFYSKDKLLVVAFPGEPKVTEITTVPFENLILAATKAVFINKKDSSFIAGESLRLPKSIYKGFGKKYAESFIKNYMANNGIKSYSFEYDQEKDKLIKIIKAGYYKTFDNIPVRYEMILYLKKDNCLILYVGCPAKNYPTNTIYDFLSSIKVL
jgi:hypothetical protein